MKIEIYKLLEDVLSVKKELKPYAIQNEFCKLISEHGHIAIVEKVKVEIVNSEKIYKDTGMRFSTKKSNLKLIFKE